MTSSEHPRDWPFVSGPGRSGQAVLWSPPAAGPLPARRAVGLWGSGPSTDALPCLPGGHEHPQQWALQHGQHRGRDTQETDRWVSRDWSPVQLRGPAGPMCPRGQQDGWPPTGLGPGLCFRQPRVPRGCPQRVGVHVPHSVTCSQGGDAAGLSYGREVATENRAPRDMQT